VSGPLSGILVVAVEQAVAAPLASCRLADAGARVIKIERHGGDFARRYDRLAGGESTHFAWLNRGKESVVADLKQPSDVELVLRILERADVFIQNLAPGASSRLGLGAAELRTRFPRLVTCDISGYGAEGPYRSRKAYDLLVQAESGLASITGTPEAPGRVGVSVCDIATGLNAHGAILEALIERSRTGRGSAVEVSLFASLADWMTPALLSWDCSGVAWPRVGLAHALIAPYGVYPVRDDEVLIAVQNDSEFSCLATTVLSAPELASDPRFATNPARVEHRGILDEKLVARLATLDRSAASELFERADLAWGFVNSVAELSTHPQLRRIEVETPSGRLSMPAPGATRPGFRPGRVPALDDHGTAIREEFATSGAKPQFT